MRAPKGLETEKCMKCMTRESVRTPFVLLAVSVLGTGALAGESSNCAASLAASVASGLAQVGDRIAFNATATGADCGAKAVFRFSVTDVDRATYAMKRDYAQKSYFEWSPMAEGVYGIRVEAKSGYGGSPDEAAQASIPYVVRPAQGSAEPCDALASEGDDLKESSGPRGTDRGPADRRLSPPTISGSPHPLVKLLSVPACSRGDEVTTQYRDSMTGGWKDLETRVCSSSNRTYKTETFLIGGVRPDANDQICVRYRVGGRHSAAVASTLGAVPSTIRVPKTFGIPTGHEGDSNSDYGVAFLGYNRNMYVQDIPEADIGGACCDATPTCQGASCCSSPSAGPPWQPTALRQKNCWAAPTAVDVTDGKLLWYWSPTTLGSQNPADANAPFAFTYYVTPRIIGGPELGRGGQTTNRAPGVFVLGQDDEGRTRDPENVGPNVVREIDLAGSPLWETNIYALNSRLPAGFVLSDLHHDLVPTPSGELVMLVHTIRCLPHMGPGAAVSGLTNPCPLDADANPQQKWLGDGILVVDRDGDVLWSWNSLDHDKPGDLLRTRRPRVPGSDGTFSSYTYCLPATGPDGPSCHQATGTGTANSGDPLLCVGLSNECPVKFANDYDHMNSVFLDHDGNLIVSSRFQAWVMKVKLDYPQIDGDGSVLWKLGQCKDDDSDADDPLCFRTGRSGGATQAMSRDWFSFQHNATVARDGSLSVFDNANIKCRTDFFDPDHGGCKNGWTDCVPTYQAYDPHLCPFASRGQSWKLNPRAMFASPSRLDVTFPQLDAGGPSGTGTPPVAVYSDALGAAQKLPRGGWSFDAGRLAYTDGNPNQAQLLEYGCVEGTSEDGREREEPCTLQVVRVLKTNHMVYRGFRLPDLYNGVPLH
jgi:Arylsulfotransferase (ASST)